MKSAKKFLEDLRIGPVGQFKKEESDLFLTYVIHGVNESVFLSGGQCVLVAAALTNTLEEGDPSPINAAVIATFINSCK